MTEGEARAALDVPRETSERLAAFESLLRQENEQQNLVSQASLNHVWARHIMDSAQLLRFAPPDATSWIDLGTGAGFPGLIVALLHPARVTLVEARRLRTDFLARAAKVLGVEEKVEIVCARVESMPERRFDVISARAFAPLDKLLALGLRFSADDTLWALPKGRNAKTELEAARASWQGSFRIEQSLTDEDAGILVATGVRRRGKGSKGR